MTKRMIAVLIAALVALAALLVGGQSADDWEKQLKENPDSTDLLLKLGRFYHEQAGLEGQMDAVGKAEKYLSRLLGLEPDNPGGLVYMGSLLTIKARDAAPAPESLEFLNEGFTMMDRAVLLAPDNPEVRLVRAVNSSLVPAAFGRGELALEDFEAIERLPAGSPRDLDPHFRLTYSFYYGSLLAGRGEKAAAEPLLKTVIELGPGTPWAEQAKALLGGKGRP
jgi:tetratricopeptide (TPR) repeat protein